MKVFFAIPSVMHDGDYQVQIYLQIQSSEHALGNLRWFLRENLKKHGEQRRHAMKPKKLASLLPFAESSIKRTLVVLVEAGVVQCKRNERILASEYWIPGYVPDLAAPVDPEGFAPGPEETVETAESVLM